ncbi:MAG: TAXI family TRAP transporter solute-binding subunit [Motiliproteus sp.]
MVKPSFVTAVSLFSVLSLAFSQSILAEAEVKDESPEPHYVTIGTGGVSGVYYPAGGSICRLVNKDRKFHGLRCTAESTDGSTYNINALRSGIIDLGVAQSDVQFNAFHGSDQFQQEGAFTELRSIFSLHAELFTVVVRPGSGIKHFADLKGKRVNIGNPGSGQRLTMEALMAASGWDYSVFAETYEMRSSRQSSALCNNRFDAMVFTVGHPSDSIKQATTSCDSQLVEVSGPFVDKLIAANSIYHVARIPGAMYQGNLKDTPSFGVNATLVTTEKVPDAVIYRLVKSIFENFDSFKALHPALASLNKQQMVSVGLTAPLHPGAIKYYTEAGLM